jgi:hypothetical protein
MFGTDSVNVEADAIAALKESSATETGEVNRSIRTRVLDDQVHREHSEDSSGKDAIPLLVE